MGYDEGLTPKLTGSQQIPWRLRLVNVLIDNIIGTEKEVLTKPTAIKIPFILIGHPDP